MSPRSKRTLPTPRRAASARATASCSSAEVEADDLAGRDEGGEVHGDRAGAAAGVEQAHARAQVGEEKGGIGGGGAGGVHREVLLAVAVGVGLAARIVSHGTTSLLGHERRLTQER